MHIHIVGICGTFMGGIAQLAKQLGVKVSGCDAAVYPPMSDQLKAAGIELIEGYDPGQMKLNPDLYVIGNAISRGNPLMEAILNSGAPYTSGPQWLSENILVHKKVLAVAGTHGKTTTSSMLVSILVKAGLNPSFLIGGVPMEGLRSAKLTDSPYFVIEADEYDTALFDKRSKFVHYRPWVAILNNLEYDHADIFPDLAAIQRQFHHLVRTIPSQGTIISNGECEVLEEVLRMGCWSRLQRFGLRASDDWHIEDSRGARLFHGDKDLGWLRVSLPGRHNELNAVAAVAASQAVGVDPSVALEAMENFGGVKRRMELRGIEGGVSVIDDFAHHPTAIEETLKALRGARKEGRIIAILEPRSNTMKLGSCKEKLPSSLAIADKVYCYQSPAVQWDVAEALAPLGEKAGVFTDIGMIVAEAAREAKAGDALLVMSNGGFCGIHGKLLEALKERK